MPSVPLSVDWKAAKSAFSRLSITHYLFLLYWMMKPFYFGPSGYMQPSDFVFVLAFIVWIFQRKGSLVIDRRELPLLLFILCVTVVNGVYFAVLRDSSFIFSIAYYIYCFLVVLVVRDLMQNRVFLKGLMWACAFNLVAQLAFLLMGLGNYVWRGFRFMGSFNDPNQYAFSMFSSFLLIFTISSYIKELENSRRKVLVLISYVLAAFFILQGGSTGMLLGIVIFSVALMFTIAFSERTSVFQLAKVLLAIVLVLALVFLFVANLDPVQLHASADSSDFLVYRLLLKASLVEGGGIMGLLKDRAIDKLFNYPVYLLFGSGEGAHGTRFAERKYEVHSTLPGILFYYGILPLIVLMIWIGGNLRNSSRILIPVFVALLIESFTLAHQRQPAFWMLIVLASLEYSSPKDLRKYRLQAVL